jgi:hypothetical protein
MRYIATLSDHLPPPPMGFNQQSVYIPEYRILSTAFVLILLTVDVLPSQFDW